MRITKRGQTPGERKWHGTCRQCNSEAEAVESELKNINQGDYRSEGPFAWEKCPVCGAGGGGYGGMIFYPKKS